MNDISIIPTVQVSHRDQEELDHWASEKFKELETIAQWDDHADWSVLLKQEDVLVSYAEILKRQIEVGGRAIEIGGIASVMTKPSHKGQGLSRICIHEALEYIKTELRFKWAMLVCTERLCNFYTHIGWNLLTEPVTYLQPNGVSSNPQLHVFVTDLSPEPFPKGPLYLNGLPW